MRPGLTIESEVAIAGLVTTLQRMQAADAEFVREGCKFKNRRGSA